MSGDRLTVTFEKEVRDLIKRIAETEKRTEAWVVREAVLKYLKNYPFNGGPSQRSMDV